MLSDQSTHLELDRPRRIPEIFAATLSLYTRFPLLIIALSALVVVPYDLVVLLVTTSSPLGQERASASTALILTLIALFIVSALVSALLVNALLAIGRGARPKLVEVLKEGLRALPVVVAAEIIAGIGIGVGFALFIVPGVILALRWAVVAQVAAVEGTDWPTALRRAAQLSARNYLRILGVYAIVSLTTLAITNLATAAAGTSTHAPQVALGIVVDTLTQSFRALVFAMLYFDLRARATET